MQCFRTEWGPRFSKWGPKGDLILNEIGTKCGPLAAEMGPKTNHIGLHGNQDQCGSSDEWRIAQEETVQGK